MHFDNPISVEELRCRFFPQLMGEFFKLFPFHFDLYSLSLHMLCFVEIEFVALYDAVG